MTLIRNPQSPGLRQKSRLIPQENDMGARQDQPEQADDVATLYSWANLHGAQYRDFSGSRQEMREQMRQRVLAEQARQAREEARSAATGVTDWEKESAEVPARTADGHQGTGLPLISGASPDLEVRSEVRQFNFDPA